MNEQSQLFIGSTSLFQSVSEKSSDATIATRTSLYVFNRSHDDDDDDEKKKKKKTTTTKTTGKSVSTTSTTSTIESRSGLKEYQKHQHENTNQYAKQNDPRQHQQR